MKESDLYRPVRDWLIAQGYTIHVEVFDADIIAVKDELITAVELKPCLTWELKTQLMKRCEWADYVIGAIASTPAKGSLSFMRCQGFGLVHVTEQLVRLRITPKQQPHQWHKKRAYRVKRLTGCAPAMDHEVAGLPACEALKLQRRLHESP